MNLVLGFSLLINILLVIVLAINLHYLNKNSLAPKTKAFLGVALGALLLLYLILMAIILVFEVLNKNYYFIFLSIFILMPFVIGKLVSYKTLYKYSMLQMILFLFSLVFILVIIN